MNTLASHALPMDPVLPDVATVLANAADWDGLTAYERTKRFCAVMVQRGEPIPSWSKILDVIGKGSANDIQRGKSHFLAEHRQSLKSAGVIPGVPEELVSPLLALWTTAVTQARSEHAAQVAQWQDKIDVAQIAVERALADCNAAHEEAQALQAKLSEREASITALTGQVHELVGQLAAQKAAHVEAQAKTDQQLADVAQQRRELDQALRRSNEALAQSNSDLALAITRLEKIEARALQDIDRARTDAQKQIEQIKAQTAQDVSAARAKVAEHEGAFGRLEVETKTLRTSLVVANEKHDAQVREAAELMGRCLRAEDQISALRLQNQQLSQSLALALAPRTSKQAPATAKNKRPQARAG